MIYIQLLRGQKDRRKNCDGAGIGGPIFGPLHAAQVVYGGWINLRFPGGLEQLQIEKSGHVYYNGIWYGDFVVTDKPVFTEMVEPFNPLLA